MAAPAIPRPVATAPAPWTRAAADWLPIALGLAVLYGPTLYTLLSDLWTSEEQAHGPIILALALWLMYRQWPPRGAAGGGTMAAVAGWIVLLFGLALYAIGRSQQILAFEVGSLVWLLVAVLLLKRGGATLWRLWFPLCFMLFMIPLPGPVVSAVTMPMKMAVSYVTEHVLFAAGYPIARSGVTLQIGPYQLLVADACAGLQTLLTLEALGLFYVNLVRHTSFFRNATLALLIVPISFSANVIRVIALTLVTYYFGDAAGQGFLHGFAGLVLFLTALTLIVSVDSLLQFIVKRRAAKARAPTEAGR
jgi:exosortase B